MDHSSHGMDMGGMDMGGGSDSGMPACKISMLWNWTTIDACFLSEQWHVRSVGDFVGSLIGIFFCVVALEAVRRLGREYDRRVRAAYYRRESVALAALAKNTGAEIAAAAPFRPSHKEQAIRSIFHFVQFGTAYILMLLGMYFNGAVLLCIFTGGAVGYFIFGLVANHLSTSASTSSPAPAMPAETSASVDVEAVHALRRITLNRPKQLNSLNDDMVGRIFDHLQNLEASELANVILIKGNGKHFCAGGDVVALMKNLENEADWKKASGFFEKEYRTNHILATTPKPVVSFMTGVTYGGGVGMTGHGAFRVATETTQIAMPETKIGLFPDVGANFLLPRLDGELGLYLGLTSFPLKGAANFLAGLATHYVPAERLPKLEERLAELDVSATHETVNSVIEEYSADASELQQALQNYPLVGPVRRAIDNIFSRPTAEEIVADLRKLEEGSLKLKRIVHPNDGEVDMSALQAWAKETREAIELRSPTSVKLTIKAIREGRKLTIDEVLQMDARIAAACCSPAVHPDFKTGVTDLLIKKIKPEEQRPAWQPATLEEVTDAHVQKVFFSSPPPFDNPPVPQLKLNQARKARPNALPAYRNSPHARWALPTERDIEKIVKGEDAGSDEYAVTRKEVVDRLMRRHNGKVGVVEKVDEVLRRKTVVAEEQTLKWL
ncbi:uncharacterized protein JCM10292_002568 [Rhodotorula paludigena]|uniref:uncharacterized protein n=1 Tax=Rhodotorula paludigena TaxID=86838 RepID=UPI00316B2576